MKGHRASTLVACVQLLLALLFSLVCGAAFVAMFYALLVSNTVAAIESAFGSFVVSVIFLSLAKKSYAAARARLSVPGRDQQEEPTGSDGEKS